MGRHHLGVLFLSGSSSRGDFFVKSLRLGIQKSPFQETVRKYRIVCLMKCVSCLNTTLKSIFTTFYSTGFQRKITIMTCPI